MTEQTHNEQIQGELKKLRGQIDEFDLAIVELLISRMEVIKDVGQVKKENNIPFIQEARWREIVAKTQEAAKSSDLNPELILKVFKAIHEESLEVQKKQ